jgi:hypothetical protein
VSARGRIGVFVDLIVALQGVGMAPRPTGSSVLSNTISMLLTILEPSLGLRVCEISA